MARPGLAPDTVAGITRMLATKPTPRQADVADVFKVSVGVVNKIAKGLKAHPPPITPEDERLTKERERNDAIQDALIEQGKRDRTVMAVVAPDPKTDPTIRGINENVERLRDECSAIADLVWVETPKGPTELQFRAMKARAYSDANTSLAVALRQQRDYLDWYARQQNLAGASKAPKRFVFMRAVPKDAQGDEQNGRATA